MSLTPTRTSTVASDSVGCTEVENIVDNDVIELERPMGREVEKEKSKDQGRPSNELVDLNKLKYTLLEELRAQEKEFFQLKTEKMAYDRERERNKNRQEDERLRLEVEKVEIVRRKIEERAVGER